MGIRLISLIRGNWVGVDIISSMPINRRIVQDKRNLWGIGKVIQKRDSASERYIPVEKQNRIPLCETAIEIPT